MATYYALPNMTTWASSGGWSLSSGGPVTSGIPGETDNAVLDANSGPSRTIYLPQYLGNIDTSAANPMTFSMANITLTILSGSSYKLHNITWIGQSSLYVSSGVTIMYFGGKGSVFPSLQFSGANAVTLTSDLTVRGVLNLDSSSSYNSRITFWAKGFNVTVGSFRIAPYSSSYYPIIDMGGGTWTFTGTGGVCSLVPSDTSTGTIGANATIVIAPATAGAVSFGFNKNVVLGTVRVLAGPDSPVTIMGNDQYGPGAIGTLYLAPGSVTLLDGRGGVSASYPQRITSLLIDGSGTPVTLQSAYSPSQAYVTGVGGTTVNYARFKDLQFYGTPVRALKSTNLGNVTNVNFIKDSGNFVPFF